MTTPSISIAERIDALDWKTLGSELDGFGCTVLKSVLTCDECRAIAGMFEENDIFRSTVVMARHGFGRGEYKYWSYPLPKIINDLRVSLYPHLAAVATRWNTMMKIDVWYPETHGEYIKRCHAAEQTKPTPLLLSYSEGDWNALHQDLYGENVFPIQVAFLLSEPGKDFTGGEFVLTEQRPRMQSRAEVVSLRQGDAVAFAVSHRPVKGTKGVYRVNLRHGVSRLRSGHRNTMGIIFHDAK
ncbi:MAG TPA: 2OG-Fe(II) oxygenase [Verrucomicrobiae bacterium]|jgi:hypothetical protein